MAKRPLNKQVIVYYNKGASSPLFRKYVSTVDIREACTRDDCPYESEHLTFDGQVFYKQPIRRVTQ